MVCMLGCGRMAAMARLLKVGSFQGMTAEEMTNEKLAAHTIHNEFQDANEANLLEEADMHVFDYRPLTDPLHLVCCNACKKPIKASQYSTHAVNCGLLNPIDDVLDIDGGISSFKKLPKKGKKIIQTTNGSLQMATAEQETPIHLDGNCGGGSTSKCGFKLQNKTMKRREVQASSSIKYHSVAPAPLATKIFYSQGRNHLRSELKHLFHEVWSREHSGDSPNS
ncbi:uncharacterized protein LOC122041797 isoform X1 [Zingiber officinale]|uniref:uncharacterized protein LOC122041797 isoform X1 n=1 Tax=Zingiber officinale TaxID=94328 RepID=UPI001C4B099B|nr:uncharacterized protein LOC122041797 isoform X1 [Zingiber officinale]XP_042457541.1 uncharacterized protein LOC122041797 isoform X1 [Zingiber officinale]